MLHDVQSIEKQGLRMKSVLIVKENQSIQVLGSCWIWCWM